MKKQTVGLLARLALLSATLIWGCSFIITKDITDVIPPFTLLTLRFLPASGVLALLFHKRMKRPAPGTFRAGGAAGLLLFAAYAFQTIGITGTTPGKNAFLTASYCVIVPFAAWFFTKRKPDRYNIAAAFLCIVGIGFVSLTEDFTIVTGDLLTLVCGVFYALHIVTVAKVSDGRDPMILSCLQFLTVGALSLVCSLAFDLPSLRAAAESAALNASLLPGVLYLSLGSTAAALTLQNFGQKYTDASSASLILTLESVFGVIFSVAFGREALTGRILFGFALIFFAVVVSETKLSFLRPKAGRK